MRTTPATQAEAVLKLLVTLLAEPKLTAAEIARAMGRSEGWINLMTMQFRDAGLNIEYDKMNRRYSVGIDEKLEAKLRPYAKKLSRVIGQSERIKPTLQFVSELDNYTIVEWAQYMNMTPSNVMNMITEYKGQKLPAGWVAYQMSKAGKWHIKKMDTDRSGKKFTVPSSVSGAHEIRIGEGDPMSVGRKSALDRAKCLGPKKGPKCNNRVLARGFCSPHYYQQRKRPEEFPIPLEK